MRMYPSKAMIVQSWKKYGLIVVGNIVFFALLYFISYRPNNDENRAAEFLSMAQEQEATETVALPEELRRVGTLCSP